MSVVQDINENCSNYNKQVPPVNCEVLVDSNNNKSPDRVYFNKLNQYRDLNSQSLNVIVNKSSWC